MRRFSLFVFHPHQVFQVRADWFAAHRGADSQSAAPRLVSAHFRSAPIPAAWASAPRSRLCLSVVQVANLVANPPQASCARPREVR
jgi:hypothetical protein